MKDYKEMTKCVLEARDAHEAKKGKKLSKASGANTASTGEVYSVKKTDKKKVMLGIAPVLGGVLVAALIGIIVSDYSVDRTEDKMTETVTEATEVETTEEPFLITEATEIRTTEKVIQEEATLTTKEIINEPSPEKTKDSNPGDQGKEGTKTGIKSGTKETMTYGDVDPEIEKEDPKPSEDGPTADPEETVTKEPTGEDHEPAGYPDPETYGKYFRWNEVIKGEGDITYVLVPDSPRLSGGDTNYYEIRYKGMRTVNTVRISRDGTISSESFAGSTIRPDQAIAAEITLEMLQSTDFSNAEKNLKSLDAKMAEEGYSRSWYAPNIRMEPSIEIRKTGNGTSLVYVVSYSNDDDPRYNETYGFSDSYKTGITLDYDLITGNILYEHLSQVDEEGKGVGEPVIIVH